MRIFKKKEGALELTLKNLIVLILSFIILLALFSIGYKLWEVFTGRDIDEATVNNFENLKTAIDSLLESDKDKLIMPYYIQGVPGGSNYGLFGFPGSRGYSQGDEISPEGMSDQCATDKLYEKPRERCSIIESCLCLHSYKGKFTIDCYKNDQIDGYYVDKESFKNLDSNSGYEIKGTNLKALVIWGNCGAWGDHRWYVRNILIKKEPSSGGGYNIIFKEPKTEEDYKDTTLIKGENIIGDMDVFGENE